MPKHNLPFGRPDHAIPNIALSSKADRPIKTGLSAMLMNGFHGSPIHLLLQTTAGEKDSMPKRHSRVISSENILMFSARCEIATTIDYAVQQQSNARRK